MFFIRQLMYFPSGILLYKNLPIYSMVNRISFCSRNSMFLPGKSEKFPLLIVCRIWFHFGPLLRSAGKTKNITRIVTVLQSIMHRWSIDLFPGKMYWGTRKNFLSYIVCRIRSSFQKILKGLTRTSLIILKLYIPLYIVWWNRSHFGATISTNRPKMQKILFPLLQMMQPQLLVPDFSAGRKAAHKNHSQKKEFTYPHCPLPGK